MLDQGPLTTHVTRVADAYLGLDARTPDRLPTVFGTSVDAGTSSTRPTAKSPEPQCLASTRAGDGARRNMTITGTR